MPDQVMEFIQANLPLVIAGAVVLVLLLALAMLASRRTKVATDTSDVLDEGRGPAARNQALIDAPSAAAAEIAPKVKDVEPVAVPVGDTPSPAPTPVASNESDDLTRIKGLGPKLQTLLNTLGVTSFAQVAAWSEGDIDNIDAQLGKFQGRIRRDNWVEQAKLLAAGDIGGYESKFGKT